MDRKRALAILGVISGATLFGFLGIKTRYFNGERGLVIASVIFLNIKFHKDYVKKYGEYVPPGYREDEQPLGNNEPIQHE